jgi:hypothetical protein
MNTLSIRSLALFLFILSISLVTFGQDAMPAAAPATVKVGLAAPKANFSEGADNAQMAAGLRALIGQYFQGSNVEIVPVEALLPKAAVAEAKEKGCDYILQVAVSQKKGGGGFGMFKVLAPVIRNVAPMAGMGGGRFDGLDGDLDRGEPVFEHEIEGPVHIRLQPGFDGRQFGQGRQLA